MLLDMFRNEESARICQEEVSEWANVWELDGFSLPYGQREDFLSSSQGFGSNKEITKCKMLEASIALDEVILRGRQSSQFGNPFEF